MIQFTTPALTLDVKGVDLTGQKKVWVTIRQRIGSRYEVTPVEVVNPAVTFANGTSTVSLSLTQQQTASLQVGPAQLQVNWITSTGYRGATNIENVNVTRNLKDEVVAYG